ncbi:velvet family protein required for yeast-phase growth [Histoplasma capsulatum var. duboisii H88]|uniref:Velvet family protein required for yeast-phase growth n=2 Tax=Ajellomyces capsulatus TaxID=5037 RepID=A0A8A1LKA9_AJEC8|nr:velvet family protein required for yeast-phase growth [Histoplasma capsulatum var. duboisii H88]
MYTLKQDRPHPVPPPPPLTMDHLQHGYSTNTPVTLPGIPEAARSVSTVYEGRIYSLDVVQQPIRARMCGFGDKDRRPLTPPPCIRLIVRDATTQKEIDINEIDTSFYVLTVDLWNAEGTSEVNLVRHSATSPSISTATSSAYPPPANIMPFPQYAQAHGYPQTAYPPYYGGQPGYNPHAGYQYPQGGPDPYYPGLPAASTYYPPGTPTQALGPQSALGPHISSASTGMFTRNLIGSLSASAFRLTDPDDKIGVWFVLQDLSVRTEGSFRLKMNFVNVGTQSQAQDQSPGGTPSSPVINVGSAPVLASAFSEVFQVYSAKKFPGVIESTPLSKCFAFQGIKIPIRKDGVKGPRGGQSHGSKGPDGEGEDWENEG